MKCFACNYEKFDSGDELSSVGDEGFIHIVATNDGWYDYAINLYACPKCKTVRL